MPVPEVPPELAVLLVPELLTRENAKKRQTDNKSEYGFSAEPCACLFSFSEAILPPLDIFVKIVSPRHYLSVI